MSNVSIKDSTFINCATIRGTIKRKFRKGNDWLVLSIITTPKAGKCDNVSVYWYGDKIDEVDKHFAIGNHVNVEAQILTSKKYKTESVVGVDISETPRELEVKFGEKGVGRYLEDINEVLLKGELLHTFSPRSADGRFSIATLKTVIDGRVSFPQVAFFGRQLEKLNNITPGESICVIGHLQTDQRRDKDTNKIQYLQSTVCHYVKDLAEE